jgi:hypothetical protein
MKANIFFFFFFFFSEKVNTAPDLDLDQKIIEIKIEKIEREREIVIEKEIVIVNVNHDHEKDATVKEKEKVTGIVKDAIAIEIEIRGGRDHLPQFHFHEFDCHLVKVLVLLACKYKYFQLYHFKNLRNLIYIYILK